jgi:hypothetical protein
MRLLKTLASAFGLLTFMLFALATPAQAQHPAYMHALANLRQARSLLQSDTRPGTAADRDFALREIEAAMHEIRTAVREEGRDPHFTPPPAIAGDPDRPIRSALTLLNEAREDVARGTDEYDSRGLQLRALRHIQEARRAMSHALRQIFNERRY